MRTLPRISHARGPACIGVPGLRLSRRLHTWLQKRFRRREQPLCSLSSSLRGSPWLSAAHHRRVAVWNRFLSSCSFCGVLETKEFVTNLPPPPPRPRSFFRALSLSRLEPVGLARTVIPNALGRTRNLRIFAKEKTNCIVTLWLRSYSQQ